MPDETIRQFTKEEAIAFAEGGTWRDWTDEQIVKFQLYQRALCMDWSRFHRAAEAVLGRSIWTHEFADRAQLLAEYEGKREKPTMQDIIDMLPKDKTIVVVTEEALK